MPRPKKTKVTFVFETHYPGSAKKAMEIAQDADVLLFEADPGMMEKIKNMLNSGKSANHILSELGVKNREYWRVKLGGIKEFLKKGKRVFGIDAAYEEARGSYMSTTHPEAVKLRDSAMVDEIIKHIKSNTGRRLVIQVGAIHTPVYHKVKEAIRRMGLDSQVEINRIFTTRDNVPGLEIAYPPEAISVRKAMFNKQKTGREAIEEMALDDFSTEWFERRKRENYKRIEEEKPELNEEEIDEKATMQASKDYWSLWKHYLKNKDKFSEMVRKEMARINESDTHNLGPSRASEDIQIWKAIHKAAEKLAKDWEKKSRS